MAFQATFLVTAVSIAVVSVHGRYQDSSTCLAKLLRNNSTPIPTRAMNYKVCKFCETERFAIFGPAGGGGGGASLCAGQHDPDAAAATMSEALLTYGEVQGRFWANRTLTSQSVAHLIRHMPARDALRLFSPSDRFLDFMLDHVRLALLTHGRRWNIPDAVWRDYVLPYSLLDERRDMEFNWRRRFFQLFGANASALPNTTAAMHYISASLPHTYASGVLQVGEQLVPGPSVHWKSETSPMRLSPAQVIELGGGSCTGTAVVMAAAARSVGVPARVTGCSQSVTGDDHHWIEFYDGSAPPSPFGDAWHTKEGTSSGNAGGPWDRPSGPMNRCLKRLIANDSAQLNTIWASSWSAQRYLPLQWSTSALTATLAFVGGSNRCGAYCQAWGCGVNQTDHWTQNQCMP